MWSLVLIHTFGLFFQHVTLSNGLACCVPRQAEHDGAGAAAPRRHQLLLRAAVRAAPRKHDPLPANARCSVLLEHIVLFSMCV